MFSAAVIWCIGVFSTAVKGHALLVAAGELDQPAWFSELPLATVCLASVVGILKGYFLFSKINNKNTTQRNTPQLTRASMDHAHASLSLCHT